MSIGKYRCVGAWGLVIAAFAACMAGDLSDQVGAIGSREIKPLDTAVPLSSVDKFRMTAGELHDRCTFRDDLNETEDDLVCEGIRVNERVSIAIIVSDGDEKDPQEVSQDDIRTAWAWLQFRLSAHNLSVALQDQENYRRSVLPKSILKPGTP